MKKYYVFDGVVAIPSNQSIADTPYYREYKILISGIIEDDAMIDELGIRSNDIQEYHLYQNLNGNMKGF